METRASLLAQLRDIHLPVEAGQLTAVLPASTFVLVVLIAAGLCWIWWRWRQRSHQVALRRLEQLRRIYAQEADAVALAQGIGALLRQHACRCFPHEQPAGLVDAAWLDFLDRHGGGTRFRQGPGQVVASLPYRASPDADAAGLVQAARTWLKANPA